MIVGKNISYSYDSVEKEEVVLKNINLTVKQGEWITVLGCNGCGKSTLIKHLNGLLELQQGSLTVANIDVSKKEDIWKLRRMCGMVFQNPDNQFVSSVVEEDIAFGLENYQVNRNEIPQIVKESLALVAMSGYEKRSPHFLSGGQKQRIAIAGVLALKPDILVFDEATSMLDPEGREEVLSLIKKLHGAGKTIIMITHDVEEAVFADRIFLMSDGKIIKEGAPKEVLTEEILMEKAKMMPPAAVRLYRDLKKHGIILKHCPLTDEELIEELCQLK